MHPKFLRTALAVGAGATLALTSVFPAHAATTSSATKALDWIEAQMTANGHKLVSGYSDDTGFHSSDDYGLTIDGLLALAAGGRDGDTEAAATSTWLASHVDDYVTGQPYDPADTLRSGALGKAMVYAVLYDKDFTDLDGHDLETDLRGLMDDSGRFVDAADTDYSSGITQALDVLALNATTDGADPAAVSFLLLQQCPNGGFRQALGTTQCTDNTTAIPDATSFALMALDTTDASTAVNTAISNATGYLATAQAASGAFQAKDFSNNVVDSSNSTGLAGSALRAFGDAPRANKAATFVKSVQLTTGSDTGAILANKADYDDAVANGLDTEGKTLAVRATAQAVLALGLPMYPRVGVDAPVEPATTIALSSSTAQPGGTITVSGGGFATGEKVKVTVASDPVTVGEPVASGTGVISQTFALPSSVGAGSHTVTLLGETSGVTISAPLTVAAAATTTTTTTAPKSTIVRTGSATGDQAQLALGLLGAGAALVLVTRRRRIIYPFQK